MVVQNVLLHLVIFMTKQKSFRQSFEWIIVYHKKYCWGQRNLFHSPPEPSHLRDLTPKYKVLNVF